MNPLSMVAIVLKGVAIIILKLEMGTIHTIATTDSIGLSFHMVADIGLNSI